MIKKLLVSACLLLSFLAFSQEGSYSPYSFYGIGDQRFKGTAEFRSMGGLTIFPDSIHINIQNPASFSALKLTTFSLGGTTSRAGLETESQSATASRTVLDYLAVGLPLSSKSGLVFGLMPYTSVGYRISNKSLVFPTDTMTVTRSFSGNGGLNRVFAGAGYQFGKHFRLGVTVNYDFGKIETANYFFPYGVERGTREINESEIHGFSFNTGLMYEGKIGKKLKVYSGVTYAPEGRLITSNFRTLSTLSAIGGSATDIDTINVANSRLKIPGRFSFGAGIGETTKWQVGAEVTLQQTKDQQNRFEDIYSATFENAIKYTIGGYYIPKYNSFQSYFSRITYRAGARYERTGLIINGQSIWDAAGTVGLGLPIASPQAPFSNVNIGLEYGKRGTRAYGLVEENYISLSVGFSFNDRWFVKRRYD